MLPISGRLGGCQFSPTSCIGSVKPEKSWLRAPWHWCQSPVTSLTRGASGPGPRCCRSGLWAGRTEQRLPLGDGHACGVGRPVVRVQGGLVQEVRTQAGVLQRPPLEGLELAGQALEHLVRLHGLVRRVEGRREPVAPVRLAAGEARPAVRAHALVGGGVAPRGRERREDVGQHVIDGGLRVLVDHLPEEVFDVPIGERRSRRSRAGSGWSPESSRWGRGRASTRSGPVPRGHGLPPWAVPGPVVDLGVGDAVRRLVHDVALRAEEGRLHVVLT